MNMDEGYKMINEGGYVKMFTHSASGIEVTGGSSIVFRG